jgi:hypothetical protein
MNNEKYINKVLALPAEFFAGWEWKEGDQYYNKELETFGFVRKCYVDMEKGLIPIPSQRQLQEMCITYHMNKHGMSRKRAILHVMGWWVTRLLKNTILSM